MKNRFVILLAFLTVFAVSIPVFAVPPADVGADAVATGGSEDTGTTGSEGTTGGSEDTGSEDTGTTGGLEPADELESDEEAVKAAEELVVAIQMGNTPLAVALGLLLLVYALRRLGVLDSVPDEYTKWVVAATTMIGYTVTALSADGVELGEAIKDGVVAGAAAVGLGEMLLAQVFGKSKIKEASDKAE